MLKLIQHISSPVASEFATNSVMKFVRSLTYSRARIDGQSKYLSELRKDYAKHPDLRPRLKTIFRIAAVWGTTPLDILLRPEEAASPSLFPSDVDIPAPPAIRAFQQKVYLRCERRFRRLIDLPKNVLLPPAAHVCREFGVSNNFQARFPDVWKKYMDEKICRLRDFKERNVLLANRYMERHLERIQQSGEYLHRRRAIASAIQDVGVPKTVARSALRVALVKMRMNKQNL
jgi:hypothetical protein